MIVKTEKNNLRYRRFTAALWSFFRALLLIGLAFVVLYTIIYMLVVSFRSPSEMLDPAVVWITRTFTLQNYKYAIQYMEYASTFMRTFILALACTLLQCFTCSVTGYGFARFKFKGRNFLFGCAILTMLVPVQIIMMPQFINYVRFSNVSGIELIDTPIPLMLNALLGVGLKSGLFIYLCRQFFRNLPKELEEAAYIDGCGPVKAYFRVALGSSWGIMLVVFLLSFVWYWNDYYTVTMFYSSAAPMSLQLSNLHSILVTARNDLGTAFSFSEIVVILESAALLFLAPVLLLYGILQKRFTQSITDSAIVG